MLDPLSDAEALAAAQAAAQAQSGRGSTPSTPSRPDSSDGADAEGKAAEALGNEQMVWEMLYNPEYSLPTADAVAAWHRAMGKEVEDEQVSRFPRHQRCACLCPFFKHGLHLWATGQCLLPGLLTVDNAVGQRLVFPILTQTWSGLVHLCTAFAQVDASDVESMTPEQLSTLVARRARTIAERAFWDSIVWRFKTAAQGQALPSQLAPLLSELGTELSGFVSEPEEAQQLAEQYAEPAVLARLTSSSGQQGGGANLTALGAMLEQLAQVLLKSGGPERAAEGADAAQQLHVRMAAALSAAVAPSSGSTSPTASGSPTSSPMQAKRQEEAAAAAALAEGLAAALRLLMTQLKVVKLDAANARLAGLARAMREQGAVRYLQTKLAAAWELPSLDDISSTAEREQATARVADKLSRTAAWVAEVQQGMQRDLQGSLSNAGLLLDASAATAAVVAGGLQSVELRSGVRASPTASPGRPSVPRSPGSSSAASPTAAGAVKPRFPVALDTWQGIVRAGLLSLVSGTTPAAGPQTPEVLMFDRARLHDLQNALQQLMVAAAGLLIVQQLRQAGGLPWDAEMRAQARRRLLVVLADPGMKLAHLVTELTQLAGATGVATEDRVSTLLTQVVVGLAAVQQTQWHMPAFLVNQQRYNLALIMRSATCYDFANHTLLLFRVAFTRAGAHHVHHDCES